MSDYSSDSDESYMYGIKKYGRPSYMTTQSLDMTDNAAALIASLDNPAIGRNVSQISAHKNSIIDCPRTEKSIKYVSMKSQENLENKVEKLCSYVQALQNMQNTYGLDNEMATDINDLATEIADMSKIITAQRDTIDKMNMAINGLTKTLTRIECNVEKLAADSDSM